MPREWFHLSSYIPWHLQCVQRSRRSRGLARLRKSMMGVRDYGWGSFGARHPIIYGIDTYDDSHPSRVTCYSFIEVNV
jgi:hypothetical protein